MYDIIGDIHGHADALRALLSKMGYQNTRGHWRHPERQAIFIGDFIDRGPKQLEVLDMVRRMMDGGSAQAVMGNHEFNAIAWCLEAPNVSGQYLRHHNENNRKQHAGFLDAVEEGSDAHREWIQWFLDLPLWLDLPAARVVHACWHPRFMAYLAPQLRQGNRLTEALMVAASHKPDEAAQDDPGPSVFKAVDCLVKGIEVYLPSTCPKLDVGGVSRRRVRVRWWEPAEKGFRDLALGLNAEQLAQLPTTPLAPHHALGVAGDKPLFIGHYWLDGEPDILKPNLACVDYSVAKNGKLVAYRMPHEGPMDAKHYVSVLP